MFYFIPREDESSSSEQRIAPIQTLSRRAGGLISFVFFFRMSRQQHPERIDSERGAKRNMEEERDNSEDDRQHACPRLTIQQSPAGQESSGGFDN